MPFPYNRLCMVPGQVFVVQTLLDSDGDRIQVVQHHNYVLLKVLFLAFKLLPILGLSKTPHTSLYNRIGLVPIACGKGSL